jgi:hypothetical protein
MPLWINIASLLAVAVFGYGLWVIVCVLFDQER